MKCLIAVAITFVVAASSSALAQVSSTVPLAEVARKEEARRKTTQKATKVFTNSSLAAPDVPSTPVPSSTSSSGGSTTATEPTIPLTDDPAADPAADPKSQAYWQKRLSTAREALSRTRTFADAMQTKINSLQNDIPNLDYPARGLAEKQLNAALAELERLKKEVAEHEKSIAGIEEEARRNNVPAGWLRPGA